MARDLAIRQVQPTPNPETADTRYFDDDCPSDENDTDSEEEGELLYRQFLTERLEVEHLRSIIADEGHNGRRREPALTNDLASLAERFNRSAEREVVRRKAEEVDLDTITQDNFSLLLSELFHDGGITQERVMVLFFFCSDLAIRALRTGLHAIVASLTRWSLAFVRGTVSAWVKCKGGWETVLRGPVPGVVSQVIVLSTCVAVMCLCVVYIRKNL